MVRFDENNTVAMCYGCHAYADANREDVLYPLFEKRIGKEAFEEIRRRSHLPYNGIKRDQKELSKRFRELFREMLITQQNKAHYNDL